MGTHTCAGWESKLAPPLGEVFLHAEHTRPQRPQVYSYINLREMSAPGDLYKEGS